MWCWFAVTNILISHLITLIKDIISSIVVIKTFRFTYFTRLTRWTCTGNLYYRYGYYGVDPYYPRSLDIWTNVRSPVDAAFSYNYVTYFFSGNSYQVFDDYYLEVGATFYNDHEHTHTQWCFYRNDYNGVSNNNNNYYYYIYYSSRATCLT